MNTRIQDRNGVKVRVHEHANGTTVEAACQCLGLPMRLHSNPECPLLAPAPVLADAPEGEQDDG